MAPVLIFLAIIFLLPIIYVILTYNTLVALRNHIRDAWSNIDTELKRRYDMIPNLVATVKGYAAHERETLDAVVKARNAAVSGDGRYVMVANYLPHSLVLLDAQFHAEILDPQTLAESHVPRGTFQDGLVAAQVTARLCSTWNVSRFPSPAKAV